MYENKTKEELIQIIYQQTVTINRLESELKQQALVIEAEGKNGAKWKLWFNPLNWFKRKNK